MTNASPFVGASLWMIGALLSFLGMAVAGRELSDTMDTFEIVFIRSLVAFAIILPFGLKAGRRALRVHSIGTHLFRNTFHFAAQFGWFVGVGLLPLATVFAIEFSTPIWAAMLAVFFLGERLHRGKIVAIILGFAGILIILKPGAEVMDPASLWVLGAAVGFAGAYVVTKHLTKTDSPISIVFYMSLMQTGFAIIPAVLVWVTPSAADIPWMFLVGATGLSAHYCMSRAFQLADATTVIPIDFLRLPMAALVGFLVYAEALDLAILVGAVLMFAGNYYNIRFESRRSAAVSAAAG